MKIGEIAIKAIHIGEVAAKALAIGANKVWEGVSKYIKFADPVVEQICLKWSSDGIGLTPEDAAKVTDIGTTFKGNTEITSFDEFEKFGVKQMREFAFDGCSSLLSVKWPVGVSMSRGVFSSSGISAKVDLSTISNTTIPYWLFSACPNLEEVIIGEKVTEIGTNSIGAVFNSCTSLRRVEIKGDSLKVINAAFESCTSLEEINIPESVETISGSFNGCTKLSLNANVLNNIKNLISNAFSTTKLYGVLDCKNLEQLQGGVFRDTNITGVKNLGKITKLSGSSIYVPFYNCKLLEYVILPSTLISIEALTFSNCKSLRYIVINAEQPPSLLDKNALNATPSTMSIYVPDESVDAYKSATNWSAYADRIKPLSEYQEV